MPRIELITPVFYDGLWPYNSYYDNLPLRYILARQDLINASADRNEEILEESIGSAGTLAARLAQSIEDDGDLRTSAVDEALHNIGAHTDGSYDGEDYVRMTASERAKLALISDEATALQLTFETASTTVEFTDETVVFNDSDTITFSVTAPNIITANTAFPVEAAHEHFYDLIPVHSNLSTPDYINYKTTSSPVAFVEGSLRVYVNGIRLSENDEVYVYRASTGPTGSWTLTSFTGDESAGTFALNRALHSSDLITIDFDRSFI